MDMGFCEVARMIPGMEALLLTVPEGISRCAYDIRLKRGQPVLIATRQGGYFLKAGGSVTRRMEGELRICTPREIKEIFLQLCGHSVFHHEEEIRNGFLSVSETYRVGISGTAVMDGETGRVKTVQDITSLVFRIPREQRGVSGPLFRRGVNFRKGVLIVGEPASGKTTLLRDIASALSFGRHGTALRMALLDERFELQGNWDLGPFVEVLRGFPKGIGIPMALRSLSPELIVCDELTGGDFGVLEDCVRCGVPLIASLHGDKEGFQRDKRIAGLLQMGVFQTLVFLQGRQQPGHVAAIMEVGELFESHRGRDVDAQWSADGHGAGGKAEKTRGDAA